MWHGGEWRDLSMGCRGCRIPARRTVRSRPGHGDSRDRDERATSGVDQVMVGGGHDNQQGHQDMAAADRLREPTAGDPGQN